MKNRNYKKSKLNSEIYSKWRTNYDEFWDSEKYFFDKVIKVTPNMSILDVGCACGGLGAALRDKFLINDSIDYTGIDPDSIAIKYGKKSFPYLKLFEGYFPEDMPCNKKYDLVIMMAWFAQVPEWKKMLKDLVKRSSKFVNIALNFRMEGPTVIDRDTSYFYYLDTQERVHEITHNIYEFVNFCCIKELGVKKIYFYGYHPQKNSGASTACRPLARSEQIQGNILLELYPKGIEISRYQGISPQAKKVIGRKVDIVKPEMEIIIDNRQVEL